MADDLSSALEEIQERHQGHACAEEHPSGICAHCKDRWPCDAYRLLAALKAVLELADELEATPYPDDPPATEERIEVARTDMARGLGRIFREAITREITGKGDDKEHG